MLKIVKYALPIVHLVLIAIARAARMASILFPKIDVLNAIKHARHALVAILIIVDPAKLMGCYQKMYAITAPLHSIFHPNYKAARIVIQLARHVIMGISINVLVVTATDICKMGNVKSANKISI